MMSFLAAALVALAGWVFYEQRKQMDRQETLRRMLAVFGPAMAASRNDPENLLSWYPLAKTARSLWPDEFKALDAAAGRPFPFTNDDLQAAHARWSAQWLAWERAHDAEFAVKTAEAEDAINRSGGSAAPAPLRARLAAVEQQKLERYQQRYEDYVKTSKALAALMIS